MSRCCNPRIPGKGYRAPRPSVQTCAPAPKGKPFRPPTPIICFGPRLTPEPPDVITPFLT